MGTNYYVAKDRCKCCNRYSEEYHIGKSSYGWSFTFHGYKYEDLISWKKWKEFLKDQVIADEYGDIIQYDDFVLLIEGPKSPNCIGALGSKNLQHNEQGRIDQSPWFNPEYDWDDEDGYAFSSRDFS